MKRELKFRAWDKNSKKMHSLDGMYAYEGEVSGLILKDMHTQLWDNTKGLMPNIELMQYTGLKDKNGKEIYEGDIVAVAPFRPKANIRYGVVKPVSFGWCFKMKDGAEINYLHKDLFKLAGNIYENPESLK